MVGRHAFTRGVAAVMAPVRTRTPIVHHRTAAAGTLADTSGPSGLATEYDGVAIIRWGVGTSTYRLLGRRSTPRSPLTCQGLHMTGVDVGNIALEFDAEERTVAYSDDNNSDVRIDLAVVAATTGAGAPVHELTGTATGVWHPHRDGPVELRFEMDRGA